MGPGVTGPKEHVGKGGLKSLRLMKVIKILYSK